MTPTVENITAEIAQHEAAIKALREKLVNIVNNRMKYAMENAASQQDVQVLCEHPRMIVVKASNLIGNPWSINFQDWASGAEFLIQWFEKKKLPPEKWYETLKKLYDNRKEPRRVDLDIRETYDYSTITRREPISAEFVKLVLDEMEK